MTRPVSTSPWIVFEAVKVLATMLFAWASAMVVKPVIFTESIVEAVRVEILAVRINVLSKIVE